MILNRSPSLARTLDRLEILRSSLRWKSQLDSEAIQKVLRRITDLREEVLLFSGEDRYDDGPVEPMAPAENVPLSARKRALLDRNFRFDGVFGESPELLEALETAEKAAPTALPVLIEGESGTGKELMARVIHENSDRTDRSFVSVNCGAISPTLIESELFGHLRGAFTGSVRDRKGKFETAHQGTIFLDEVAELPPESQVKLLRVLEEGEIQRVGSDERISVDARVVAATNRELHRMMAEGGFREDLYYRLSVISLTLPPLRDRRDEIPLLIEYFRTEAAEKLGRPGPKLSPQLHAFLLEHPFRGNIRELRNLIYRVTCLADGTADLCHLPPVLRPKRASEDPESEERPTLETVRRAAGEAAERRYLAGVLSEVEGNVSALARQLGMNRSHLQTLVKKHGLRNGNGG